MTCDHNCLLKRTDQPCVWTKIIIFTLTLILLSLKNTNRYQHRRSFKGISYISFQLGHTFPRFRLKFNMNPMSTLVQAMMLLTLIIMKVITSMMMIVRKNRRRRSVNGCPSPLCRLCSFWLPEQLYTYISEELSE